jgi:hypothetical protein
LNPHRSGPKVDIRKREHIGLCFGRRRVKTLGEEVCAEFPPGKAWCLYTSSSPWWQAMKLQTIFRPFRWTLAASGRQRSLSREYSGPDRRPSTILSLFCGLCVAVFISPGPRDFWGSDTVCYALRGQERGIARSNLFSESDSSKSVLQLGASRVA